MGIPRIELGWLSLQLSDLPLIYIPAVGSERIERPFRGLQPPVLPLYEDPSMCFHTEACTEI